MKDRADWVDYAKAIGIILVVYGHVARGLYNAGIELPVRAYMLLDSMVYSFHMPLFFFLSGLFFYSSFAKRGGKNLVFNKIDTVFYPYVVWSILQGSIEVVLSNYTNGSIHFADVFSLLWAPRAQFWFLYALFFVFLVVTIVYSFLPKARNILGIVVFALSALLYLFPLVVPSISLSLYLSSNLVFFGLGIIFTKYFDIEYFATWQALALTAFAFGGGQLVFHGYFGLVYTDKGLASLLLAIASIAFVTSLASCLSLNKSRFLAAVGASSMAIFLAHILAGSGVRVVLNKFLGVESFGVHLLLGCLAGILLPMLFLTLINRFQIPYVFSAPVSSALKSFAKEVKKS